MNNFSYFDKPLLEHYIVTCRGDANEIAKRRGCAIQTVYGALRDHQLRGMLRAEKMKGRKPKIVQDKLDSKIIDLLTVPDDEAIQMLELRASRLRMLIEDEDSPNYYTTKSRIEDALAKLRETARKRIAKELSCKRLG